MRPFCVTVPLLVKRIKKSGSRQAENSRSLRLVKEKKGDMPFYRMSLLQSQRQCAPADHWHEQIVHLIVLLFLIHHDEIVLFSCVSLRGGHAIPLEGLCIVL